MNNTLYNSLKEYIPLDEEERLNCNSFLQFIEAFGNHIWTRDNLVGHVTSSAWVINPDKDKVLMAYHKIYDSFGFLGGHADGDKDLLYVAQKEAMEESGIKNIKILNPNFIDICSMFVKPHIKHHHPVPSHIHFNTTFLFEATEDQPLQIAQAENSAVEWIKIKDIMEVVKEDHMKPVYARLIKKMNF